MLYDMMRWMFGQIRESIQIAALSRSEQQQLRATKCLIKQGRTYGLVKLLAKKTYSRQKKNREGCTAATAYDL